LDLRGRKPGEVAKILEEGAIKGGMDRKKIKTILKETEALKAAMYHAEAGDLIVVFYEKYQPIIDVIEEFIKNKDLKNIEIKLERA
jgi:cyanophycin synthetase